MALAFKILNGFGLALTSPGVFLGLPLFFLTGGEVCSAHLYPLAFFQAQVGATCEVDNV